MQLLGMIEPKAGRGLHNSATMPKLKVLLSHPSKFDESTCVNRTFWQLKPASGDLARGQHAQL